MDQVYLLERNMILLGTVCTLICWLNLPAIVHTLMTYVKIAPSLKLRKQNSVLPFYYPKLLEHPIGLNRKILSGETLAAHQENGC